MEHELQKNDQERGGKDLETEEKVVNTLPELAVVSEIVKENKDVKREVGVALNDENTENVITMIDNNNIKENESEKDEKSSNSDSKKLNIGGSVEKQVLELDNNDQIKTITNTVLSVTGSKEKITKDITLDHVSISKTTEKSNLDDETNETNETVETVQIDNTIVETPFEKTTFESTSRTENNNNETTVKSLETDKFTVQNLETKEITSTDTAITKKEVNKVSPDQTLIETITFKENKDKISEESTTKQETITETPVDKTTITLVMNDSSTINKAVTVDPDDKDLVIAHEYSGDKSKIDRVIVTEVREEKPQLEDNDDEDLETSTPATPESEEDLINTISRVAPELSPFIRDLKQVSDKLDPIKRSWNNLKLRKGLGYSITTETDNDNIKSDEEEKLLQEAIDSIREAMTKVVEFENQVDQEEGKVTLSNSHVQTLIQPTSSSPSSVVADVMESMITPGFNNNVVLAMNICFWLLFTALIFMTILTDYNYMVLLNLGISILLYISLCWFIVVTRASQLEEAAEIAKKND
ncbi:unnamed protein product [Rhizophagus irregularis]|uniref:V-ATPase assembly factor pkr1 n=1 Tax=Rhizophagus irregularis TaxID=588596 RepID=A0A915ZXT8_9GLOM|nr:unnamed protein product [Rhizophagus irregularis]CAB5194366.1 unnamed protein product [Rhizophagus irregularis]CAB5391274.1 unnamed protein product [Rhizophagus irregularis]